MKVPITHFFASPAGRAGVVALAYFAAAEVGHVLSLKTQDQVFATFWPPAGLLLAALVLTGYRLWPAVLLAACTANLASNVLLHDKSVPVSLGFCAANCAEACIGAWLLRRLVGLPISMTRINDVLGLACLSAVFSTLFGATIGAGVVNLAFDVPYGRAWLAWWAADALGVLVIAPVVLSFQQGQTAVLKVNRAWRMAEGVALLLGTIVLTQGVYGEMLPPPLTVPIFILPFLLWAALRFGPRVAAVALLVVAVIGVWNTNHGRGPYTVITALPAEQLIRVQATLSVVIFSIMTLAAAVAERKQTERQRIKLIGELEQALAEIKTLQGLIPICGWCKMIRDDKGFWQQIDVYLSAHTDAKFSHGICPDCLDNQLGNLANGKPAGTI